MVASNTNLTLQVRASVRSFAVIAQSVSVVHGVLTGFRSPSFARNQVAYSSNPVVRLPKMGRLVTLNITLVSQRRAQGTYAGIAKW